MKKVQLESWSFYIVFILVASKLRKCNVMRNSVRMCIGDAHTVTDIHKFKPL
jgi:hypothetical protein